MISYHDHDPIEETFDLTVLIREPLEASLSVFYAISTRNVDCKVISSFVTLKYVYLQSQFPRSGVHRSSEEFGDITSPHCRGTNLVTPIGHCVSCLINSVICQWMSFLMNC